MFGFSDVRGRGPDGARFKALDAPSQPVLTPVTKASQLRNINGINMMAAESVYEDEAVWRAYAIHACLNPDTHLCPSSYFARSPFPAAPVRLTLRTTIQVLTGQSICFSFVPYWCNGGDYQTLIAAAYVVDTTGTDKSAAAANLIPYTQKLSACVPNLQADGSAAPAVCIMGGSVKINIIKGSRLDGDPVIQWTGSGNTKAVQQWNTGYLSPANDWHNLDVMRLQSGLGAVALNSVGNEMTNGPRDNACSFYGLLPPVADEMGRTPFKNCDNFTGTSWSAFNTVNGGHPIDCTQPLCSIKNISSNTINVELEICRNVFVVPTEQALVMNPSLSYREVRFRLPIECSTLTAAGAAHLNHVLAHRMAISRAFAHPHAKTLPRYHHVVADKEAQSDSKGTAGEPWLNLESVAKLAYYAGKAWPYAAAAYQSFSRARAPPAITGGSGPIVEEVN